MEFVMFVEAGREKKKKSERSTCLLLIQTPSQNRHSAARGGEENEEQTATRAKVTVQRPDDLFSFKQTEMFNFSWAPAALSFSRRQIEFQIDFLIC